MWIQLRSEQEALNDAAGVEARQAAGAELPLAGVTLAVKDNIDVADLETTAACPSFAYRPATDAPAVARLKAAGAIVLGKTNLDQFATGLTAHEVHTERCVMPVIRAASLVGRAPVRP